MSASLISLYGLQSFMAMPIFSWDADKASAVVRTRFWVYWTITIPLTTLVLGSWFIWMQWRERYDRKDDGTVRKQV